MKVSIVVGGRWHAFDHAAQLHRRGLLHRIITNYPSHVVSRWGIPRERVVSLPLTDAVRRIARSVSVRADRGVQHWVSRSFGRGASKHLQGSDIVHCLSSFAEPSIRWARESGVPCIVERLSSHITVQSQLLREEYSLHGMEWHGTHPEVERIEEREYVACDALFVPSRFVEQSFLSMGFPARQIVRNALGVSLSSFVPPVIPPEDPRPDSLRVIYAGSLTIRKGIPYLLRGFELARVGRWKLDLVGSLDVEVRRWLEPSPAGIRLLGHRPQAELSQIYGDGHCFVMPSIEEGMAMVQMQALACGLPLVCTTNTGGEDLLRMSGSVVAERPLGVTEFPAGYVVPIRSPDAIAWCLRHLASDPEMWRQKRRSALLVAQCRLDWSGYADRAQLQYQELLK